MARKKRKSSTRRRKKKSKTPNSRSRSRAGKRKLRRRSRQGLGSKVSNAYRAVVDTIKGTDQLRNKLEPPATSEAE
jgi:hypothetical protein